MDERSTMEPDKRLYRSESNRMIAGVAGGFAAFAGVDATIIRLAFVFLSFFGGSGIVAYLVMWLLVPSESKLDASPGDIPRENLGELRGEVERGAKGARAAVDRLRGRDADRGGAASSPPREPVAEPPPHELPPEAPPRG
jgi:phage shock protein C